MSSERDNDASLIRLAPLYHKRQTAEFSVDAPRWLWSSSCGAAARAQTGIGAVPRSSFTHQSQLFVACSCWSTRAALQSGEGRQRRARAEQISASSFGRGVLLEGWLRGSCCLPHLPRFGRLLRSWIGCPSNMLPNVQPALRSAIATDGPMTTSFSISSLLRTPRA